MDTNAIIPAENKENDIEENSVIVVKQKKKRKKYFFFKKLICFTIIIGLSYFAFINYKDIKDFILDKFTIEQSNINQTNENSSEDNNLSVDNSDNLNTPNENINIPSDAYKIFEKTMLYTEVTNETELEINLDCSNENYALANDIYKQYGNEAPCVLIIHSSCLESYSNGNYYKNSDSFYANQDNVSLVGKIICDTLNDNNINAIHIDDIFANGSIYSSTKEYKKTLEAALKKYPSISYVLDVSRNVIVNDDLTMNKMICNINNNNLAQIKLTIGSSTNENNSFWHKNISFANKLALENSDLIYDVTLSCFELSQDIKPIAMRIDVGAYSNSINEALLAGHEFALRLSEMLYQSR